MRYLFLLLTTLLLGCQSEDESSWHFANNPSLADNKQKLCIIGDSGTGTRAQYAVSKAMERVGCHQIRVLGDIIYPAGLVDENDLNLQRSFVIPYDYYIKREIPFYLILGNHDYKTNRNAGDAWKIITANKPNLFFPNNYYSENWGDVCLFSIDTTWYDKLYFLHKRSPQTSWLRDAMAAQKGSCNFSVVFGHHPLISSGSHGDATLLQSFFLEDEVFGKVDLHISGHEHHLSDEGKLDGTYQLISGAAGKLYEEEHLPANEYYTDRNFGFMTLSFSRDREKVIATYQFYTVHLDDMGKLIEVKQTWSNSIEGQGLRL